MQVFLVNHSPALNTFRLLQKITWEVIETFTSLFLLENQFNLNLLEN